jgi:hypothetical protein
MFAGFDQGAPPPVFDPVDADDTSVPLVAIVDVAYTPVFRRALPGFTHSILPKEVSTADPPGVGPT